MSIPSTTSLPAGRGPALALLTVIVPVLVTGLALAVGLVLIAATGASVPQAISSFWNGAFGSNYAIGASLNRAVPFALVGLGFIVAAKANLTNVGGEGLPVQGLQAHVVQAVLDGLVICFFTQVGQQQQALPQILR